MEELLLKLSFLKKKWIKQMFAIALCIVVGVAALPISASNATDYNPRILRESRLTGDTEDNLQDEAEEDDVEEDNIEEDKPVNNEGGEEEGSAGEEEGSAGEEEGSAGEEEGGVDEEEEGSADEEEEGTGEEKDEAVGGEDEGGDEEEDEATDDETTDNETTDDETTEAGTTEEETTEEETTEDETETETTEISTEEVVEETVDVKVVLQGTNGLDTSNVSFIFLDKDTGESVSKNEDHTYTMKPDTTYQIEDVTGLDDYEILSINGTETSGDYSFVYDGTAELVFLCTSKIMTFEITGIELRVTGPSDGVFSSIVDNIQLSFIPPSGENEIQVQTSGGSCEVELETGTTYTLYYSGIQNYYLCSIAGSSVEPGDTISYTCDGSVIEVVFAAVPKMYSENNGDYTLNVDTIYNLYQYFGMNNGGDVSYNDGSMFSLYFNNSDKTIGFRESTEDADKNYLVLNKGASIGLDLSGKSNQYMMKATYSASSDGTTASLGLGTYGSSISTYDGTSTSKVIDAQSYRKLLETGKNYIIGGDNPVAIHGVTLYQVEEKTLQGTLYNNGAEIPDGVTVTFTNSEYNISRTATVNTDGTFDIAVPTTTEGILYDVTLSEDASIYFVEITNNITLSRSSTNAGTYEVEAQGAVEIDFDSEVTGFLASDITGVNVKLNRTTTTLTPSSSGKFSATLTAGKTYTFSANGVPEYEVYSIVVDDDTANPIDGASYTYEGTEQKLTLIFGEKRPYKVYFDITSGDEAILGTKDFTTTDFQFTFTDGENVVTPTVQKETTGEERYYVELSAGTYDVSLTGTGMDDIPYELGATTVEVTDVDEDAGEENIFYFSLEKITRWNFANYSDGEPYYTAQWQYDSTEKFWRGLKIDVTSGKLFARPDQAYANSQYNGTAKITIPMFDDGTIEVVNYGGLIALYDEDSASSVTQTSTAEITETGKNTKIVYTGGEGEVTIVPTGSEYLYYIEVTYSTEETEQDKTTNSAGPYVDDGVLYGSNKSSVTETYVGQRAILTQAGGDTIIKAALKGSGGTELANVGYYVFPATTGYDTLSFDIKVTSNSEGIYAGVFTTDKILYSVAFRSNKEIQRVYTNNTYADNSGDGKVSYAMNERFHVEISRTSDTKIQISYYSYSDESHTDTYERSFSIASGTDMYYGFAMSNATAEISNMLYTQKSSASNSGTVTFNQNDEYTPSGTAPVPRSLVATATEADGATVIGLSIMGDTPAGDGFYTIQRSADGGSNWETLVEAVYGLSYTDDTLPAGAEGKYVYRVAGQLGRPSKGGTLTDWVKSKTITFEGALDQPIVTATGSQSGITLEWTYEGDTVPDYYTIYRYSFDDGYDNMTIIRKKETGNTYTDLVSSGGIIQDDPYFYIVQAVIDSADYYNESLITEEAAVWSVAPSNRTGFDYEENEIIITNRSYETVFTNKITIEGLVNGSSGTIAAYVNGTSTSKEVADRETFSFELTLSKGRNDVYLIFTAADGTQTKKSFNYIYTTDYDAIVDASYTGTDGEAASIVSGATIPIYSTITAALNAAPSGSDRHVILILEGSYNERVVVDKPNITLLGEDPEKTIIHYAPGYVGDDMSQRCAIYIKEAAANFSAENVTFQNDYEYGSTSLSNQSADALRSDANAATYIGCIFNGMQDTLFMGKGQQYYYRCQINGLIDYIYCEAQVKALFNECILTFTGHSSKSKGYITAPRTSPDNDYGLVFNQCAVVSDSACGGNDYRLARPWGADGMTTWINCFMGSVLNEATPYDDMSGNTAENARFYEYYSYGPSYEINTAREQVSKKRANELISAGKLGYKDTFIGSLTTDREMRYTGSSFVSDTYSWSEGDDSAMSDYFMEGYAVDYGVSGGGLLKEESENYYEVSTAEEFLEALSTISTKGAASVIELKADIGLGCNEVGSTLMSKYSSIISAYKNQPLTHPTLLSTGVSTVNLKKMSDITIFSHNGFTIKHANISIKQSSNIMIRNIRFDELWEWDEATGGNYDRNDWDYITIEKSDGVWIDHCSFYKAYDGVIDIKSPNPTSRVTISWCNFFPGSKDGTFFEEMMSYIEAHPDEFPTTYQVMVDSGMTSEQISDYAYAQKKTFLLGQSDSATDAKGIKATFANNYFANSMDRLPRVRYGTAHVYNTIMDSQKILDARNSVTDSTMASKFVSNGASSTCNAQVLLEGCYISGIKNALNSGNGSSPSGYINAINSVYYMDGARATLEVKNNSSADDLVLVTNATTFRRNLPYTYSTKNAVNLFSTVMPYSGAGKVTMTTLQWEKAAYNVTKKASESSSVTSAPESSEDIPDVKDYEDIKDAEANAGLEELLPEEEETMPEVVPEESEQEDDTDDGVQKSKDTKEEPEEKKEVGPIGKLGETVLINGKTYIVASNNGDIAYRVSAAITEAALTTEVMQVTGIGSLVDLVSYLKNDLANTSAGEVSHIQVRETDNMHVYDISVVILQPNGEWIEATAENFPSQGLNVTIPYPSGTGSTTHRFAVSHLILLGCNGKTPGTIEYLKPNCTSAGMQLHINSTSPFTVVWEPVDAAVKEVIKAEEETAENKWVTALKSTATTSVEEEAESRARNGSMSTRFTIDSVMGSGYLLWVSLISIAIMFSGNYIYYRHKRREEIKEEEERVTA